MLSMLRASWYVHHCQCLPMFANLLVTAKSCTWHIQNRRTSTMLMMLQDVADVDHDVADVDHDVADDVAGCCEHQ